MTGKDLMADRAVIGVEDCTALEQFDEDAILANLSQRYSYDRIYTYTSSVLIAVNPYKKLNENELYSQTQIDLYRSAGNVREAHPFAVASKAFNNVT